MGSIASRQNAAVEEADTTANHPYRYPPKTGNYFGSHFIMGGEKFDTPQPESYLFGENADLNFLGSRPTAFPYPPPQANEPTKTLKSLVNIRKESVRFVKTPETVVKNDGTDTKSSFNIEFVFDADAKCAITIYYFCTEDITPGGVTYNSRDTSLASETIHCKRGVNQLFSLSSHSFTPGLFTDEELTYSPDRDTLPIVIHCVVEEGQEDSKQSHTTICVVDHHSDSTYGLRALKQKIFVDGLCYLLQEIYGIENKSINKTSVDEESEDNSSECVICMSDTRDTLILPCRHLCLCNSCADSLRYQANNCPICRAPFRALLQIRAVQKCLSGGGNTNASSPQSLREGNADNIPPGYIPVSLIEALNGPPQASPLMKHDIDAQERDTIEAESQKAVEALNRDNEKGKDRRERNHSADMRMSVLMPKDNLNVSKSGNNIRERSPRHKHHSKSSQQQNRDSLKIVNEKNVANLQATEQEDDSETENLSPLLHSKNNKKSHLKLSKKTSNNANSTNGQPPVAALHMDGVHESIDDADTDLEEHSAEKHKRDIGLSNTNTNNNATHTATEGEQNLVPGEDSDYYTPEDPHTTILSPLCPDKNKRIEKAKSKESLSITPSPIAALKESANSLPDSPISGSSTSTRSSGDSYSSSSSTRKLLSSTATPINEITNRKIEVKMCDDKQVSIDKAVNV